MKVMILSITTGQGHHSAAKSIGEALELRGVKVKIVDVYKQIDKNFSDALNKGFLLATKHTAKAYRAVYELIDTKTAPSTKYSLQNVLGILMGIRFEKFIEEFGPDVIICTHVFSAQVVNELKRRGRLTDIPTIGIVTDYTIHPFWEEVTNVEYVEIASEFISQRANIKGITNDRLLPFGIPIQKKFSVKRDKTDVRAELSLPCDGRIILVMAGSMGYGNMPAIISGILRFDSSCTILAVCGNNKKLYNNLVKKAYPKNVKLYGFTDNVDVLMDAADCIVTKPGGLTTTESMAKNLPMIFVNPLPGQEDRNQEFFLNSGLALAVTKTFTIDEALFLLFNQPGRLELIKSEMKKISKPTSSETLADFVIDLAEKKKEKES